MNSHQLKPSYRSDERVTEIILPTRGCMKDDLLLPIIAKLSQPDQQWLTWISNNLPSKNKLIGANVNLDHLRTIRGNRLMILCDALELGNSHTVIAEYAPSSSNQHQLIEQACLIGKTNAILIRYKE